MKPSAGTKGWNLLLAFVLLFAAARSMAQQPFDPQPTHAEHENVPRVPGVGSALSGVNVGLTYAGVHNSTIGWYEVLVPAVSYAFSPRYSADISTTVYLHRLVQNLNPGSLPSQRLVLDAGDSGDTLIGLHASFHPKLFEDMATVSLTAPTGNRKSGLGTGRVTFDFNNHMERFFGRKGIHLDLGIGDSSAVTNNLLMRDYNSLGTLAHFETGTALWTRRYGYGQVSAYEQLPIGSQKIYQFVLPSEIPGGGFAETSVLVSTGLSEDNGITTSYGIPLTAHMLFSGYYNRSLRQHQDTVSLGMTFVMRGLPGKRRLSMIDKALREAAGLSANPQ